jgi:hypothetical protein
MPCARIPSWLFCHLSFAVKVSIVVRLKNPTTATDGAIPGIYGAAGFGVIILAYESVGGMGTAAVCHVIQAGLMMGFFFFTPLLLESAYGGLAGVMQRECENEVIV